MRSNKSNEVPLQNPRYSQTKDSTRGMDFLCFIALFWKMFYHELFETLGSFYRKHSPASIWKLRPCVIWLPFCRDSSFVLWSGEYLLICIRNCQLMIQLPRWCRDRFFECCRGGAVQEQKFGTVGSWKKWRRAWAAVVPDSCSIPKWWRAKDTWIAAVHHH